MAGRCELVEYQTDYLNRHGKRERGYAVWRCEPETWTVHRDVLWIFDGWQQRGVEDLWYVAATLDDYYQADHGYSIGLMKSRRLVKAGGRLVLDKDTTHMGWVSFPSRAERHAAWFRSLADPTVLIAQVLL